MKNGFVVIHKKIIDWQWFKFPYHLQMFVYLIAVASWKDGYLGRDFVKRGSVVTSFRRLREDLGCSLEKVQIVLKDLEHTGEIEKESNAKNTIIHIKNYDQYQDVPSLMGVPLDDTLSNTLSDTPSGTKRGTRKSTHKGTQSDTKSDTETERKAVTLNNNNNKTSKQDDDKEPSSTTPKNKNFEVIKVENVAEYFNSQNTMWRENAMVSLHIGKDDNLLDRLIARFQQELIATGVSEKSENDLRRHFLSFSRVVLKNEDAFKQPSAEKMADATAYGINERHFDSNW